MTDEPIGPTGLYPDGRLRPGDKGELNLGVTHEDGKVIVAFNTPVTWLGLDPDDARRVAAILLEHAEAVERELIRTEGH